MAKEVMNAKSLEHICSHGTVFKADRGDLSTGVRVLYSWEICREDACADFAEFGAWHLNNIHPQLTCFPGYNNIHYKFDT